MKRRFYFIVVLGVLILTGNQMAQAQNTSNNAKATEGVSKPQDAGNKICPVTGEKIDEKTKATYEYNGKIYNLCCSACTEAFRNDPEKYIQIVNEELKNNK